MATYDSNVLTFNERSSARPWGSQFETGSPAPAAGKVRHDARGTAIWNWELSADVLAVARTPDLLQILDNPVLQMVEERGAGSRWVGDPYNRG